VAEACGEPLNHTVRHTDAACMVQISSLVSRFGENFKLPSVSLCTKSCFVYVRPGALQDYRNVSKSASCFTATVTSRQTAVNKVV
jgi:hypothetical protein